jgi:hypothetical protein
MTSPSSWGPCDTCKHADRYTAPLGRVFCTLQGSWFYGKLMPMREGCTKHQQKDEDDDEE